MTKEALKSILALKTPDEVKIELIKKVLRQELEHNSYLELLRQYKNISNPEDLYFKAKKQVLDELIAEKTKELDMDEVKKIGKKFQSETESIVQFTNETRETFLKEPEKKKKSF